MGGVSGALVRLAFPDSVHGPVEVPAGCELSEFLTAENSPVLFGCRTGICGTCVTRVRGDGGPVSADEREVLDVLAPGDAEARLACQVRPAGDLELRAVPEPGQG